MKKFLTTRCFGKIYILIWMFFPIFIQGQTAFTIKIVRTTINSKSITGEMYINGIFIGHTLELPWRNNEYFISSIPDGTYGGTLRYDKNERTSLEFWRIELKGTEPRTYIQIHKGNVPEEIKGCIIVGTGVINKENKIEGGTSKSAFDKIKETFYGTKNPLLSPEKSIEVIIDYKKTYSQFKMIDDPFYIQYQVDGKWRISDGGNITEIKRDLKHVYFFDVENEIFSRIPLFGGCIEESESENGSYSVDNEACFTRGN